MKARVTRILDAAMLVFRRHGFRRSSIEQAAEAAGLTRQALYHHFKSKEALFRAVIERLHEDALAAEIAAADAGEKRGGSLADILVASSAARLRPGRFARGLAACRGAVLRTSRCRRATSTRYMPRYAAAACRDHRARLPQARPHAHAGMTPRELARCVEMAVNGTKSAYPAMQPADAFLKDLDIMLRMLIAGAMRRHRSRAPSRRTSKKSAPRSTSRKSGDRR